MKRLINLMFVALVIISFGCGKEEIHPEQKTLNKLQGTWVVGTGVYVDGEIITEQYAGFSITFINDRDFKVFEVENGGEAFPNGTDSYTFVDESYSVIERASDGVQMTIDQPSREILNLSFSKLPDTQGGRTEGTYGNFIFNLRPLK